MSYLGPFPKVDTEAVLTELRRELGMRERCYPDWVRQGKYQLTRETAALRIAVLRHAITLLKATIPQQQTLPL
ncbi:hypothetical protein [Hymenobacter sp. YC55]|uniref:hypothetical protein n=1 Tax=Hymenobacter sp. YC55 TaxID=3034019 RepID=UPI0023F81098|nr:hypothetical protein [Hymenobacter sp. YC55]MDF7809945.1 hypothetical protein [Hymenobacter sp. YC55]